MSPATLELSSMNPKGVALTGSGAPPQSPPRRALGSLTEPRSPSGSVSRLIPSAGMASLRRGAVLLDKSLTSLELSAWIHNGAQAGPPPSFPPTPRAVDNRMGFPTVWVPVSRTSFIAGVDNQRREFAVLEVFSTRRAGLALTGIFWRNAGSLPLRQVRL